MERLSGRVSLRGARELRELAAERAGLECRVDVSANAGTDDNGI